MRPGWRLRSFVWILFALMASPLLVVVGVAFNPGEQFTIEPLHPSLRWFAAFFARREYVHALFAVTLPIACMASILATIIGTLASIALVRIRVPAQTVVEAVAMLPVLVPGILLGVALYLFFAALHLGGGYLVLIVGHTLIGIPFVIRVVGAGLAGLDPRIEEAAVNLGCNRVLAFIKVGLPLLRSSILSGSIFAFILSFSDVNIALFLAGPGTNTLPLQIFSDIQWQGDPTIAAASTIQIVVVTGLILVAQFLTRRRLTA